MQEVRGSSPTLGGLRVSQLQSLWRDKHPAIKGLRPPEHHAGKFRQDQKDSSESTKKEMGPMSIGIDLNSFEREATIVRFRWSSDT